MLNVGAGIGRAQGIFRAKLLDLILQGRIHDIRHLSKLTELYSPRVSPDGDNGRQLKIMYQDWFSSCDKCATPM